MKILMETEMVQIDGHTEIRRCAKCPQEFYFQRQAQPDRIAAEIEAHLAICPGRKDERQAA
jgi:hypothetical protein